MTNFTPNSRFFLQHTTNLEQFADEIDIANCSDAWTSDALFGIRIAIVKTKGGVYLTLRNGHYHSGAFETAKEALESLAAEITQVITDEAEGIWLKEKSLAAREEERDDA